MPLVEMIAGWIRNKYLIATLLFCVWILFFDHYDLLQQVSRTKELSDLKSSRDYYKAQIEQSRNELEDLILGLLRRRAVFTNNCSRCN